MKRATRRWLGLVVGAGAVASAVAVVYLALMAPIDARGRAKPDRRRADPDGPRLRVTAPLERRSRTHVVVRAHGTATGGEPGHPAQHEIAALLDTALSVAITTPRGERLFGLHPGIDAPVPSHGFSGASVDLMPIGDTQTLAVSVENGDEASPVRPHVGYLGVDQLVNADVILPPHWLGPEGGAVSLDLATMQFAACETLAACEGTRTPFANATAALCGPFPELVIVATTIAGVNARLLLDTGGSSWIFREFFDAHDLGSGATSYRAGKLVGAGNSATDGRIASGEWTFAFGEGVTKTAKELWIVEPHGGAAFDCHLDGSIGLDVLDGCVLVLEDGKSLGVNISCP